MTERQSDSVGFPPWQPPRELEMALEELGDAVRNVVELARARGANAVEVHALVAGAAAGAVVEVLDVGS
ncbi:MAG: hypothetical protein M3Y09_14045 [Actinomycetota bacterium]|nr:hypothetical protein [Actinomycetota bacterium]